MSAQETDTDWYRRTTEHTLEALESAETGLTGDEAAARLDRYGLNELSGKDEINRLAMLFHQFQDPLICILLLASGVAATLGHRIPADMRLLRVNGLLVEEAMLTGESLAAPKTADTIDEPGLTPGDQRNMAFMGSIVISGRGGAG